MPPKQKRKPQRRPKVAPESVIKSPAPGPLEVQPQYWSAFKALLANCRFVVLLALICIPVGIAAQLSFIKFRCAAEPFLGSVEAACKDNMLRMILGGPLMLMAGLAVSAWVRQQKQKVRENWLLLPFIALLPTLALPFIHQEFVHDKVILGIKLSFVLTFVFVARHKLKAISDRLFAKPEFRMECSVKKDKLNIVLEGKMLPEERNWIFDRTLAVLGSYGTEFSHIEIDCRKLEAVPQGYKPVIEMLVSFARFSSKSVDILGEEQLSLRPGTRH